jgi:hypothetical protein
MEVDRNDLKKLLALCYGALDDEWSGYGTPWDCEPLCNLAEKYGISKEEVLRIINLKQKILIQTITHTNMKDLH